MNYSPIDSSDLSNLPTTNLSTIPTPTPTPIAPVKKQVKKPSGIVTIKSFLNENKGTLLMAAMGLSIGFAFKDFVKEFIESIINSIVYVVTKKSMGSLHFNAFKVFNSFISLLLIIIIDYYIYKSI